VVLFDTSWRPRIFARLRRSVQELLYCINTNEDTNQAENDCWINSQAKGHGRIAIHINLGRGNNWIMNFGIASLLIHGKLTTTQKEGIVNEGWELSHLCGNWRCMNHEHFTVESKTTNLQRMACFNINNRTCTHSPPCMIQHKTDHGSYRSLKPKSHEMQKASLLSDSPVLSTEHCSEDEEPEPSDVYSLPGAEMGMDPETWIAWGHIHDW
jgi:hypothetical protein